jgi:hypothetical protein
VRVCLGAARDRDELQRGLTVLAQLLRSSPVTDAVASGP